MDNLTASLEDYLELISKLSKENENVKAVELSKILNVSRASVAEALNKLADKKLIRNEGHKGIFITKEGKSKADEIITKHNTFKLFFEEVLGLENNESEFNACKIEHFISNTALERMNQFQKFCSENSEFIEKFKTEFGLKN